MQVLSLSGHSVYFTSALHKNTERGAMLKKSWFSTRVTSSDGWSVEIGDRGTLVFKANKVRVWIGIEIQTRPLVWIVYSGDMRGGSIQGAQLTDEKLRSFWNASRYFLIS